MSRVVVTRELPPEPLARLRAAPEVSDLWVSPHDRPLTPAELSDAARDAHGLLAQLVDRVDEPLLARCPSLKVVANFAVGYDNLDVAAARRHNVTVTNTPDVLTESTAELTWALILATARRLGEAERRVRRGDFPPFSPMLLLGTELHGKTLGVVGLGRIGAAVARRARAFSMDVLYTGPRPRPEAEAIPARFTDLDTLLRTADVVSLHCPLNPDTRHLIDARRLSLFKPSAYLINVARGPVVDEAALVEALRTERLRGAGLDVYEREPRLAAGLTNLEQVVLAPHIGSATHEARTAMGHTAVTNVLAVLRGDPPPNPVT